jgi:SRSO17 transposase
LLRPVGEQSSASISYPTSPECASTNTLPALSPFGCSDYGVGDIEQQLRRAGKDYVLGVGSAHVFQSWGKPRPVSGKAEDIARTRRSSDWKRLSAGAGTKGPRLHDWCYIELADLEARQFNSAIDGLWTRGLLIRRRIVDGDLAFFATWCPAGTSIETPVAIEGHRWRSKTALKPLKTNSASITTRPDPGMGGIVTYHW